MKKEYTYYKKEKFLKCKCCPLVDAEKKKCNYYGCAVNLEYDGCKEKSINARVNHNVGLLIYR